MGAAFGAYLLFTINRALPVLGIPDFWQRAVVGVLIIGAIVLDRVRLRQSRRLIGKGRRSWLASPRRRQHPLQTKDCRYLDHGQPLWRRVLLTREMAIIALLIVVIIVASAVVPRFGTTVTLGFLLLDVTPILLIALPMTLVIITGEIDLVGGKHGRAE